MARYYVLDAFDVEVHRTEDVEQAKRAAEHAKSIKLNGCTVFNVEKRERVWTTSTLEEAISGTPFDPGYKAPAEG